MEEEKIRRRGSKRDEKEREQERIRRRGRKRTLEGG